MMQRQTTPLQELTEEKPRLRVVLEAVQADVCLPDYWRGHHLPHIAVPVSGDTTMKQLRQAMRDELRQGAVMGNTDDARLLSADMVFPEEVARADRLTRAAYAAVNRLKLTPGKRRPFPNLDPADDRDSVYAYFVFVELEQ